MKRLALILTVALLGAAALGASPARAAFGFAEVDEGFSEASGGPQTQAGSHPFAQTTTIALNTHPTGEGAEVLADEDARDLTVSLPAGLVGDPTAVPPCSNAEFLAASCGSSSQVGITEVFLENPSSPLISPVYSVQPPSGFPVQLGFIVLSVPVKINIGLNSHYPYNVLATPRNIPDAIPLTKSVLRVWGVPASPSHDGERQGGASKAAEIPFLTLPRSCAGPLRTTFEGVSWQEPEATPIFGESVTHDNAEPPNPIGMSGCSKLPFGPSITAQPTTKAASSPTGLDFSLNVENEGLSNPSEEAVSQSDIRKAVVTLPEGFSVNPSVAEGLNVCTEAQFEAETAFSAPGANCPDESKLGTVEVETPLLDENVNGEIYQAAPYENPFGSLVALYMVIRNPTLGIVIRQPLRVEPDPVTGRLTTVAEELPQLPFSHFRLHFREGTRSPLASPPACGTYAAEATLYPWSGNPPVTTSSAFQIFSGPNNGPCPKGGLPPFHPELTAGTLNNAAGRFSPFNVKITRTDSEQEITHFSIKLPPGIAGKLAGIPFCSDAAIARAKARTGPHGGREELDDPSCPAASQVGSGLAGAGVGPSLAYAPDKIYLAGPYHGSPISFVAIASGVVGPFDIGTVVVRLAIKVNPETGEVFLDSTGSDPIPHIIHGIPIHLRDIRAYTDRPEFTFNPTSCERKSTAATVLGSGLDFGSEADDRPFVSTSPFQAADCAALAFAPKLSLSLLGGTKRGDFPRLKAFLRMRGFGEAGVARAQVTLPKSEFIANAHFNTICTRTQFKQAGGNGESCPAGSIYGWAKAKTPILSDPLEGPIFLRSSEHKLPDVVASLRGQEINVHLVGHVDSVKGKLRNTFETVPDAPVEWASFSFQGGKKGLFENSTNLCHGKHRAIVSFSGQNGKRSEYEPAVKVKCGGGGRKQKRGAAR